MQEELPKSNRMSRKTQYVTTASATLGALAAGSIIGFTTNCVVQLTSPSNSTSDVLHLTSYEASWFASSVNLGAVFGAFVGGIAAKNIGRRGTLLAVGLPFVLSWLLIAFAQNYAMLMVGRILTGVCMGIVCTTAPPYIAEFASPDIRGILASCFQVMLTTGILYAFVFGALLDWRTQAGVCAIPPALLLVTMIFAKESPVFLLLQGKESQAANSLQYFRGKDYPIHEELKLLKDSLEEAKNNRLSLAEFLKPYILRPLLISLALMVFQQTSGVPMVMFNLTSVFRESGSALSDNLSVIVIGIVQVIATCGGSILVDKVGRRKLLIISSTCMALSIVGMGIFSMVSLFGRSLARNSMPNSQLAARASPIGIIPLILLIVFISTFSIGLGPVPWIMMGELFPPNARETAAGLSIAVNLSFAFLVTLTFFPLRTAIGDHGVYWICGAICALSLFFSIFVIPETKGRTLQQISTHFRNPESIGNEQETRGKQENSL